nr:hypothetical protein [Tanacetum cinerariifolium]
HLHITSTQQSCLLHHLRLPTLPSTPILSQGGYFRKRTRSCRTEVLQEDPEEYEDDESEDGLIDYPMDGGDDGEDDDGDSSGDDADDEDDEDEEDEEEEEHLALVDSANVVPTVEPVSPPEGTEHVIPPPFTDTTTTRARITV